MIQNRNDDGTDRRHILKCMVWSGTGVLWALSGGVPVSLGLLGEAEAATATADRSFTFLQISDSHIGFDKAANPHALDTFREAVTRIGALPMRPDFVIHTGDVTHLSKPQQFDDAAQVLGGTGLPMHVVPGEHDVVDAGAGKLFLERYGKGTKGAGWYSFDQNGVHFVALVNVVNLKAGGLGNLGADQLAWLADDLKAVGNSTPVVVFAHIPLWTVYADWGWGTDESAQVLALLRRFGSVTVLNGHIHQIMQKVEGNVVFHTARSTAFPQPAPGTAPSPGPMTVAPGKLRGLLGITDVAVQQGESRLAVIDSTLANA